MDVWLLIIGGVVLLWWYIQYLHDRGKKGAEYLGYYWDINVIDKRRKNAEKMTVHAADARKYLIRHCRFQDAMGGAYRDVTGAHELPWEVPKNWGLFKSYIKAPGNYKPKEENQAPDVMYVYARFIILESDKEWELKSIEQSGWSEARESQLV